ncbi:DUF2092 domain-containing protein [Streptomyces sp. NPDC045470]|uniref:LolA family protein n=1 Tax=Streptomyces sp. NPDC045470 TaxID=3155469 RepID=UPI0033EFA32C
MPRNQPAQVTDEWDGDGGRSAKRRRTMRYAVPAAVVGITAATIGLVPAFAGSGSPDLPKISAQDLIAKVAASDVQQLSGTVRTNTDLGLPSLSGAGAGAFGGSAGQGGSGSGDKDRTGASASPQNQLMDLASGSHTLRVAADGPDKQRVSVVGKAAEYNLVHNGRDLWGYDSKSNTAYHSTIPAKADKGGKHGTDGSGTSGDLKNATPQELAKKALDAVGDTTSVTVDGTAKVAGRDAYQLSIKPKQAGSTVDSIRISVDAETGVPLKFTLTPKGGGAAAIDVGFTSVDFAKPAAGTFDFKPPKGAEVVDGDKARAQQRAKGERTAEDLQGILGQYGLGGKNAAKGKGGVDVIGSGWTSIAHVKGVGSGLSSADGKGASGDAAKLLDSLGEKVNGKFGSGRLFSTRLVNALVTDDGSVYAGAVDKESLIKAAEPAR